MLAFAPYALHPVAPPRRRGPPVNPNAAAIIADYETGLTLKQVSSLHAMSPCGVRSILVRAGVGRRRPGSPVRGLRDQERAAAMVAAYEAGDTLEEIGARHTVTRERARQIIRKAGLSPDGIRRTSAARLPKRIMAAANRAQRKAKAKAREDRFDEIVAAYRAGDSLRAIADRFGYASVMGVSNLLTYHAIPRRRPDMVLGRKIGAHVDKLAIVARYLAGETAKALAAELGVSQVSVRKWVSDAGARKRAPKVS